MHVLPGRTVTELNVPGVKFEVLKRPYDTAVQLFVQDLCLVDRLQTFGPEYELVVCSSGRTIFTSPSPTTKESPEKPTPSPTCPDQSVTTPSSEPSHRVSSLEAVSTDIFDLSASVDSSSALLALTYTSISPLSPHHPATRDLGQEEMGVSEGEPHIQKIRVQCTAVDALSQSIGLLIASHPGFPFRAFHSGLFIPGFPFRAFHSRLSILGFPFWAFHSGLSILGFSFRAFHSGLSIPGFPFRAFHSGLSIPGLSPGFGEILKQSQGTRLVCCLASRLCLCSARGKSLGRG